MPTPFHAELVTPERVLFSGEVDEVTMRTDEGEISFLALHEDYVAAADITVVGLNVRSGMPAGVGAGPSRAAGAVPAAGGPGSPGAAAPGDDGTGHLLRAAVHGGFVQVDRDGVTILASVAELASEIDVERARRSLERAEQELAAGAGTSGAPPAPPGAAPPVAAGAAEAVPAATLTTPSPAMLALLEPDAPSVRARRARARLEAAGAP